MKYNDQYRGIDFLWYTYFGITKTAALKPEKSAGGYREARKRCIWRAYRDLNRTLGFTYSGSALNKKPTTIMKSYEKSKEDFKFEAESFLQERLSILLGEVDSNKDGFDDWHEKTCNELVKKASDWERKGVHLFKKGGFTYGHAQKWVNMTLKNMLVMNSWGLWSEKLNRFAEFMHIPIDNYILAEAHEKLKKSNCFGLRTRKNGDQFYITFDKEGNNNKKTWSQLDCYDQYKQLEDALISCIDEDKMAIEWETDAWLGDN